MVLNAVTKGSATAGGGAYVNAAGSIGLYQNEWTSNSAMTGSGAVNFQTVTDGAIANDTYTGYSLLPSHSCIFLRHHLLLLHSRWISSRLNPPLGCS